MVTLYEDYVNKLLSCQEHEDAIENEALIESIMKMIKAKQLIAKTQAKNRVEPVLLPKEPNELKLDVA